MALHRRVKFQVVMTRIANRPSKSTGHGAIQVPDIPRFKRCAYPKAGGIIRDSRDDRSDRRPGFTSAHPSSEAR